MLKIKALWAGLAVALVQAGCGGGGGGGGGGSPTPSEPPPAVGSERLLAEVTNTCSFGCLPVDGLFIDTTGEFTVFYRRIVVNGDQSLHVANGTASALQSSGEVEGELPVPLTSIHRVNDGRFLAFQDMDDQADVAREVVTADAGDAAVSAPASAPPLRVETPIVRDLDGNLSAIVTDTTAPFPTAVLPGNISVALVTPQAPAQVDVKWLSYADENSVAPRALRVYTGREIANGPVGVYVSSFSLEDGTLLSTSKVSPEPVVSSNFCPATPKLKATGAGEYVVSWLQMNDDGVHCDLYVNGRKMNSDGSSASHYAATGGALGVVSVVWGEVSGWATNRLRWSTRNSIGQWSDPAGITAAYEDVVAPSNSANSGPDNTLVVQWQLNTDCDAQSCTVEQHLVSKFVNGTWTTRSLDMDLTVQKMAINAAGQAAVLGHRTTACGAAICTELSVFSF